MEIQGSTKFDKEKAYKVHQAIKKSKRSIKKSWLLETNKAPNLDHPGMVSNIISMPWSSFW